MKLLLGTSLVFLCACTCSSQGVSPLLQDLVAAESDSLKVSAYQALMNHYRFSSIDSSHYYGKQGLAFVRERHYSLGEGLILYTLAQVNERHGFLDEAKDGYVRARSIFSAERFTKGVAGATNGLGVVAGRTGRYDEATRQFINALALFESINNREGVIQSYIKLGVVSDHLGNLDKALEYYLKAEELNNSMPASTASPTLLNNIGIVYGRRNDIASALKYFRRGLRESDPTTSTGIHITLLGSMGLAYDKAGRRDSAWFFQQQALSLARRYNLPEEEARSLVNLADLGSKVDPGQSLQLLAQALTITQRIQHLSLMAEVYDAMIALHKERNEFKIAMELSEKRQLLKDSLFSIEKTREIANLHATKELGRRENEIKDLALRNERAIFQRNLMIAVAIAALAMIGIVWFYNTRISNLNSQLLTKQNELKTSNNTKDKLFSILGHDLRTPLNQVIGLLDLFALQNRGADESPIIDKLRQQSQITLETLDNLLDWGRSQLKGIRLNQQTLHVKDRIKKSIHLTGDYATQKNVKLSDNVPSDLYIFADQSHFDFVIRNLLSNAIKFSHTGGSVAINAFSTTDQQVIFSITDSGVGIPAGVQTRIFTSDNESIQGTWNEKGTGIGLMLCREYITENGGKLWLESKEGRGSTFYFSLTRKLTAPTSPSLAEQQL